MIYILRVLKFILVGLFNADQALFDVERHYRNKQLQERGETSHEMFEDGTTYFFIYILFLIQV